MGVEVLFLLYYYYYYYYKLLPDYLVNYGRMLTTWIYICTYISSKNI